MKIRLFDRKKNESKLPFFTPQDLVNIRWFWNNYLVQRTPWLLIVLGLILVQGVAYQQFLSLTESGLRVIFDEGVITDLIQVCAIVFGLFTVRAVTSYVVPRLSTWLAASAVMEMRRDLIEHMMTFDLSYFDRTSPGETILRLVSQAEGLSSFVGQATVNAVRDFVTVIIVSGYLIYKAPVLFASALVIAPAIILILQFVSHNIKMVQRSAENALGAYMNTLEETVNGMRTVKISNQERFEEERLLRSTSEIRALAIRLQAAQATVMPAIDIASAFAYALVIGFGGYMAISPSYDIDGAAIIAFLIGLVMVFDPLRNLAKFFTQLQASLILLDGVNGMNRIKPTITDVEKPLESFDTTGEILLSDVTFAYSPESPLFDKLSMEFRAGERTAIVGATGSGKTTILSLISRLYEIESGKITIGGTNIQDIRISNLRESFSVVAQDIVIFNASLWENIKYVRPQSTDEEIWEAAEAAEIADLIRSRGDMPLGPKGAQLSGGQKQRIAIARAFLRKAPILLLDEATSALDQRTEERVKRALARLAEGKTTIIVAHRLSAISDADRIYVLDQGRAVESGTHQELLDIGGLYHGMYSTQKGEYH
ncbi:ABC transporter ATP-binding protein [Meridianimarinicoccus aquatilis]|uniref:ABC transporter ATP-binding protein n=1 Tax=Meridianimarinicoccus aquatilis TaxID=2552766 RepID=A0A4R6B195_9RHOB|nr:ABC transporter ATP-binding protein [Fluviibacterium aquatile]QIE43763.1 ABC transporter ATP-binding protein [Rhodobacteraceae bacterium SC52]TDL90427.1 ABC transporter ATP-binding protein [Fluviibacterium aquatile]